MLEGRVQVNVTTGGLLGGVRAGILGGGTTGIAGGIGKIAGSLGLLAGVATIGISLLEKIVNILTQTSGILKGVLTGIWKSIMLLLKPIGDILGTALMPILFIIRPIALFFNMLMRPYIMQAMRAMRAGGIFMRAGETAEATAAFTLGFAFLIKPLTDAMIFGISVPIKMLLMGFQVLGDSLLKVLDPLNLVRPTFNKAMTGLITGVDDMTVSFSATLTSFYDDSLDKMEIWADRLKIRFRRALEETLDEGMTIVPRARGLEKIQRAFYGEDYQTIKALGWL